MPAIAVLGAAAAWGLGGGAAIGAVIAGTATLGATLTAVATVGATLGAIGAVTHDKTLSTIGTVMGAVGGIGSIAANAGLFGAAANTEPLFGSAPATADQMGGDVASSLTANEASQTMSEADAYASAGIPMEPTSPLMGMTGDVSAENVLPNNAMTDATGATTGDAESLINGSGGSPGLKSIVSNNVDDATNQLVKGEGGGTLPSGSLTDQASINAAGSGTSTASTSTISTTDAANMGLPAKGSYVGETSTASDGTSVSWNGTAWAKQDTGGLFGGLMHSPLAQYGIVQAAGSFLAGAFDPLKPAQVDQLNAQAANNRAAAALTTQQTKNMTGQLPVASRVTGTPAPIMPGGIINNAPVTGTVGT